LISISAPPSKVDIEISSAVSVSRPLPLQLLRISGLSRAHLMNRTDQMAQWPCELDVFYVHSKQLNCCAAFSQRNAGLNVRSAKLRVLLLFLF